MADTATIRKPDETVTLGDKSVELSTFDRYKGQKGRKDLLAVISSSLIRAYIHFHNNKSFRCISTKEQRAICCQQLGEPQQKFGFVVFQYSVDQNGDLIDVTKLAGKTKLWIVSEARYEELSNLHKKWPLLDFPADFQTKQHDLSIFCKEEQFQRMDFIPTPSAHWKTKQNWYDALKGKEQKARERLRIAMGKQLNELEIMEVLGASVPAPGSTSNAAGDLDLGDALED